MISSLRFVSWATLGKDQVYIFKSKIFLKEKYESQKHFTKISIVKKKEKQDT